MHYFQFLIEDQSSEKLIIEIMNKVKEESPDVEYCCKSFKGIGGFTKKNTVKETKTGKLLNDLATYLKGFNKSLAAINASIFVILDNDDNDTELFHKELENVARINSITIDHVFCIAIEEVEAWLLGDRQAILAAYPNAKINVLQSYNQDSICGTWEKLADIVFDGGSAKIKKERLSYIEIGTLKAEWSSTIGRNMNIHTNNSPSFNYFISELEQRIQPTKQT